MKTKEELINEIQSNIDKYNTLVKEKGKPKYKFQLLTFDSEMGKVDGCYTKAAEGSFGFFEIWKVSSLEVELKQIWDTICKLEKEYVSTYANLHQVDDMETLQPVGNKEEFYSTNIQIEPSDKDNCSDMNENQMDFSEQNLSKKDSDVSIDFYERRIKSIKERINEKVAEIKSSKAIDGLNKTFKGLNKDYKLGYKPLLFVEERLSFNYNINEYVEVILNEWKKWTQKNFGEVQGSKISEASDVSDIVSSLASQFGSRFGKKFYDAKVSEVQKFSTPLCKLDAELQQLKDEYNSTVAKVKRLQKLELYREAVKFCLEEGNDISAEDRVYLDLQIGKLGISFEDAKSVELEFFPEQELNDSEKEYVDIFKKMVTGQTEISSRVRRILDREQINLGIPKERALQIESLIQSQII